MPQPVAPLEARELARSLFMQGLTGPTISEELNKAGWGVSPKLVYKWCERGEWRHQLTQAKAILVERSAPNLPAQVAEQSRHVRAKLAQRLADTVAVVENVPLPTNLGQIERQQQKLQPLIQNSERVFNWSAERTVAQLVGVESLSCDLAPAPEPAAG